MTIKVHLETLVVDPAPIQYDIFLSYSHRDDKIANQIVKLLQKLDPKLRIFFDIQELKTGKIYNWDSFKDKGHLHGMLTIVIPPVNLTITFIWRTLTLGLI